MRNLLLLLFLVGLTTGVFSRKFFGFSQPKITNDDGSYDLYIEDQASGDLPVDDEDGDDDGSGSGSGDGSLNEEEIIRKFFNFSGNSFSKEVQPLQPQPTAVSTETTVSGSQSTALSTEGRSQEMLNTSPTSSSILDMSSPSTVAPFETEAPFETKSPEYSSAVTPYADDERDQDAWEITPEDVELNEVVEKEVFASGGNGNRLHKAGTPEEVTSENLWERTDVLAAVIACGVVGFLFAVFLLLLLAYRMKKKDEGSYDLGDTKLSATAYHKAPTKEFYA